MIKKELLKRIQKNLDGFIQDQNAPLWKEFIAQHPADIAEFLEDLSMVQQDALFLSLHQKLQSEVFTQFSASHQARLIARLDEKVVSCLLQNSHAQDLTDAFDHLSDEELKEAFSLLQRKECKKVQELMKFPSDSAGGIMAVDVVTLSQDFTVARSIELLQRVKPSKDLHRIIYLINNNHQLIGYIKLDDLVLKSPKIKLSQIVKEVPYVAHVLQDQEEIAHNMVHYNLMTVPVVNDENILLGVIPTDTLVDVIQQEASEDVQKMSASPITESYFEASVFSLFVRRGAVLTTLLIAESVTSVVVHKYEAVLTAFLMSFFAMLVSTGGNASSQTSAIVIQGMSSGDIHQGNMARFMRREFFVGLLLAIALMLVTFIRVYLFSHDLVGTLIVSSALGIVVLLSVVLGSSFPIILKKLGMDPAFSAGPFLATMMDILGIFIYCYIASIILS